MKRPLIEQPAELKIAKDLKSAVQMAIFLFEKGNIEFSAVLATLISERAHGLFLDLKKKNKETDAYLKMVLKNKLPKLDADRTLFKDIGAKPAQAHKHKKLNDFYPALLRLKLTITILISELKSVFIVEHPVIQIYKKFRKEIKVGFLASLLILGVGGGLLYMYSLRSGLKGEYYKGRSFRELKQVRLDKSIDFDWENGNPLGGGFPNDKFSIRWTGYLYVPEDGEYEFTTLSDDGVRFFLGGTELISNWTRHYAAFDTSSIKLEEGYYPIKLEYFEHRKTSSIKLFWKPEEEEEKLIIPSSNLVPSRKYLNPKIKLYE